MTGAGSGDPELERLLLEELRRHAAVLAGDDPEAQRRAVHALKGSAALAGERALSEALARIERRLGDDADALAAARELVTAAADALENGDDLPLSAWPDPPGDLRVGFAPLVGPQYVPEMRDRIDRIDALLAMPSSDEGVAAARRELHALKGAARAASDEAMAWFCHGLEERLETVARAGDADAVLAELARWRGLLLEILLAPARALDRLRANAGRPSWTPTLPRSDPPPPPSEPEPRSIAGDDATVRVPATALDRISDRVRQLGEVRAHMNESAAFARDRAAEARSMHLELMEAVRLIGPPKPWGAPAAAVARVEAASRTLARLADRLEHEAIAMKEVADRVRTAAVGAQEGLSSLRTSRVDRLFERVVAAARAEARRAGRDVRFTLAGEGTEVDRAVAEVVFEPLLQLARNAVAHGIEAAAERAMRNKPRVGTIHLGAEARSGALRFVVEDDGAGMNVADVRLRAVASGALPAGVANAADDATLLALLFVPGFTTRDRADLLAGRGVGLDLALAAVHRLGGTIRLESRPGEGLTATIDVPSESGIVRVLWLEVGGAQYALPVRFARRVQRGDHARAAIPLDACLGLPGARHKPMAVEIDLPRVDQAPLVGVDAVSAIEEVLLLELSPLVKAAGPFAGAIAKGDGLCLCLDGQALGEMISAIPPNPVIPSSG